MTLLEKLFKRHPMQTTTEKTEAQLRARLAEITASIERGEGDILALLEEKESTQAQVQATAIQTKRLARDEYQANINKARAEYIESIQRELAVLWDALPRARWSLHVLAELDEHAVSGFDGKSFAEL